MISILTYKKTHILAPLCKVLHVTHNSYICDTKCNRSLKCFTILDLIFDTSYQVLDILILLLADSQIRGLQRFCCLEVHSSGQN